MNTCCVVCVNAFCDFWLNVTFCLGPDGRTDHQVGRGGVACRVQRVGYELPARGDDTFDPPVVAAVATLLASGTVGGEHEVSFRPSECADFLVPRRKVMQASGTLAGWGVRREISACWVTPPLRQ